MNSNISNNNFSQFLYDEIKRGHTSYGLCPECNQPNTGKNWCKECYSKKFQQNFNNWTSENEYIDEFIKESQTNARNRFELLEWVPYDRLRNISYLANGECDNVYRVTWLDGWIMHWDYEERDWKRLVDKQDYKEANNPEIHGYQVVLKSSSKFDENTLNEWKLHLQCQREALSNNTSLIPLLGITQNPYTLNYMIIMPNASLGNLRNNLSIKKDNPNDKFYNLWDISKQLEAIHKLNLAHGNFHSGNLLYATHDSIVISDFRLCRLANQPNINNDIYELLPHFAPEVLNDKLYTKAADIYSFGILMWEMTSGAPAPHICKGDRPEIIEGTIPEYIELMKRCWDNDPEKRPTANELINIFYKWSKKYPMERNDEKRIPASVRTESYGLPDTKMTLAESEVRTSDFDLSSKKKFGKKIMIQKVKNKPKTIHFPKPMGINANTDSDYYRRLIDSIRRLSLKATRQHADLVKDLKQGRSFPYATRIFKETSSSLHKPNFQKDKLGRGKKGRL